MIDILEVYYAVIIRVIWISPHILCWKSLEKLCIE